ncbi:MAG: hypothetical protein A3G34_00645 [Candidatus Lindowbacteria bacterium RIFCSPLOWO2_12_FULL_62_27]|nr:MAG: hypothetical protein A3G34_00645 [Candidatus Lindowbacteria bacterium RIFCSPLOWO2_12_FULL_62_27]OGH58180.1 MAG: hypothetical protein A3I06_00905 [Candidatus Lindowbacteria bacterium RIFCSPLOWO2_02_FULL_62_12]
MSAGPFSETVRLLKSAGQGDDGAFRALLAKYQDRIHLIARFRLGQRLRRKMDSMDIVQDAMLRALKSGAPSVIENEGGFIKWLYSLVEHQIIDNVDYFDAGKRALSAEASLEDSAVRNRADGIVAGRGDEAEKIENTMLLESLLDTLEDDERDIILHRDIYGYSFKEIAALVDSTSDAVRVRYGRIKFKLSKLVADAG